eukprot:260121_1
MNITEDEKAFKPEIKTANAPNADHINQAVADLFKYKCKYHYNKDSSGSSISFYPSPHLAQQQDICTKRLPETKLLKSQSLTQIKSKSGVSKIEAVYDFDATICVENNSSISPFITGACKAFNEHYPFRISPNNILLLILQAIAIHVDQNAEKLRDKYVLHEGIKTLVVSRDSADFVLKQQRRDNDWNGVIREFVQKIDKNTQPDTVQLMEADFSDSTLVDVISNKICIMDICKNYFRYGVAFGGCGFPKITLSGTKADWVKLKDKVVKLLETKVTKQFGKIWGEALIPILDRFVNVYDGYIDCLFWNSMIKLGVTITELQDSDGSKYSQKNYRYTGWFNVFFPFITDNHAMKTSYKSNPYCKPYSMNDNYAKGGVKDAGQGGNNVSVYPLGLASVPVNMWYEDGFGKSKKKDILKMKFVSGIIGYQQCPNSFEIKVVTGWLIGYQQPNMYGIKYH